MVFLIIYSMQISRAVIFILLTLTNHLSMGQTSKKSPDNQVVLFVCEHGAARSTIAAAYFNKLAKEKNLNYTAIFRGTDPDTVLTTAAKKGLVLDGFDTKDWQPQLVTSDDISIASTIITFDCTLPTGNKNVKPAHRWDGIPPVSKDYQLARDHIIHKVETLIKELEDASLSKK